MRSRLVQSVAGLLTFLMMLAVAWVLEPDNSSQEVSAGMTPVLTHTPSPAALEASVQAVRAAWDEVYNTALKGLPAGMVADYIPCAEAFYSFRATVGTINPAVRWELTVQYPFIPLAAEDLGEDDIAWWCINPPPNSN